MAHTASRREKLAPESLLPVTHLALGYVFEPRLYCDEIFDEVCSMKGFDVSQIAERGLSAVCPLY